MCAIKHQLNIYKAFVFPNCCWQWEDKNKVKPAQIRSIQDFLVDWDKIALNLFAAK